MIVSALVVLLLVLTAVGIAAALRNEPQPQDLVRDVMEPGKWYSAEDIADALGGEVDRDDVAQALRQLEITGLVRWRIEERRVGVYQLTEVA